MTATSYRNVEIPLDATFTKRQIVDGAEPGTRIYGVYVVPQNFVDNALPAGAQVTLYFGGAADEVLLTPELVEFTFPCGHTDGVFFTNGVALAGKRVRLLVDYSGFMLQQDR